MFRFSFWRKTLTYLQLRVFLLSHFLFKFQNAYVFFGGKIQILWNSNIVSFCQNLPVLASRNDLPLWMSFMPDNSRSAALWIWPFLIGPLWFDEFFWKIGPAFRPPVASPVEDGIVGLMLVLRSWNYRVCFIFMYQSILEVYHSCEIGMSWLNNIIFERKKLDPTALPWSGLHFETQVFQDWE